MFAIVFVFLLGTIRSFEVHAQSTQDPCLHVANHNSSRFPESFLRPSDVNRCMATVPVNRTGALDLIKGVREMLDIYSYEDYAKNSRNRQLSLAVDLRHSLSTFEERIDQYASFPDFSREVNNLLNSLHDGHTVLAVDCSGRISYDTFLPLAYFRPEANKEPRVFVHPDYDQFLVDRKINKTSQFDVQRSLAGAEVTRIDGRDTLEYLAGLLTDADVLFGNIDPQTRWNQLFVNLRGHPTPRLGYGVALTSLARSQVSSDELSVTVRFENGTLKDAVIPWLGLVDTDYHTLETPMPFQQYYSQYVCMAGNATLLEKVNDSTNTSKTASTRSGSSTTNRSYQQQQYLFDREYHLVSNAPSPSSAEVVNSRNRKVVEEMVLPSSDTTIPKANGSMELIAKVDSGFWIYQFKNTSVGVLYYANFNNDDKEKNSTLPMNRFHHRYTREMTKGLQTLKRRGVDTLLIDVSGNNGGLTELGSFAMLSLFPSQYPGFATTLRSNPEIYSYLDGSDGYKGFCGTDGRNFTSLTDWLGKNNSTMVINGMSDSYTQLIVDDLVDSQAWQIIGNATFPRQDLFTSSNMMIVSNGKCASTCAQVTMYLQDVHGVRSAGFGGQPSTAHELQTVGGVRGAQVLEMLDEDDPSNNMYNFTMKVTQMTINFRTAIHYQKKIPTEYVTRNVDYSYQHTRDSFNSFENTWRFVAETHFPKAMNKAPSPSTMEPWESLTRYPPGWFDGLLALEAAMDKNQESPF